MTIPLREATEAEDGQRVDNFLIKTLKGVPRTRIYKAIRCGEVRVNGSRVKAARRLCVGDKIRIPPIRTGGGAGQNGVVIAEKWLDRIPVLFEDEHLMVVNKPSGLAVHGGTGMAFGLIEAMRRLRPHTLFLELVHRLDRETSGCLILAKSRPALLAMQKQLSSREGIKKYYLAFVKGRWDANIQVIDFSLQKVAGAGKLKRMIASADGRPALSEVKPLHDFGFGALVEIELVTGKTHQARVHCACVGHPIAGDRQYGDKAFNAMLKEYGLNRLFLHASRLRILHPVTGQKLKFKAPLPDSLRTLLAGMNSPAQV